MYKIISLCHHSSELGTPVYCIPWYGHNTVAQICWIHIIKKFQATDKHIQNVFTILNVCRHYIIVSVNYMSQFWKYNTLKHQTYFADILSEYIYVTQKCPTRLYCIVEHTDFYKCFLILSFNISTQCDSFYVWFLFCSYTVLNIICKNRIL